MCPIYKKDSSLDSWEMSHFNNSTTEDIRVLLPFLNDKLDEVAQKLSERRDS